MNLNSNSDLAGAHRNANIDNNPTDNS